MSRISHDVGMHTGAAQASRLMRVTDDFWQHVRSLLPVRKRIAANLFLFMIIPLGALSAVT
jgi:hypothetical protein